MPDARCPPRAPSRSLAFSIEARNRENTPLLAVLGTLLAAITAVVIWQTHHLLVSPPVLAAIALPWLALGALLRIKQDSIGFEGKYVDLWSIPHCVAGMLLGLVGVPFAFVIAIAIVWEVVEICARTREYPTNRIADIVLAAAGWLAANALAGGSFALLRA